MSLFLSTLPDPYFRVQHFSPDPTMLFSGVVACATDVRFPLILSIARFMSLF